MPERIRGIDASALDAYLAELVDAGLLETEQLETGEYYVVTEAGRTAAKQIEQAQAQAVEQAFSALNEEELGTMVELSHKILSACR